MSRSKITRKLVTLLLGSALLVYVIFAFGYPAAGLSEEKKLSGAQVFKANCGKCHSERYPSERTDEEWKPIVTHMRVIGGLTAKEAKAVLEYLQENNTDEPEGNS